MLDALTLNALVIAAMVSTIWMISLRLRDVSIIDIAWGTGFCVVAWTTWFHGGAKSEALLLPILVSIWGGRLTIYLAYRNHGKPEDYRYRAMREKHGRRFPVVSFVTVFALQGLIMWVVALPLQTASVMTSGGRLLAPCGVALWAVGLFFEAAGDWQLTQFKRNPANTGRVMDRGLWRYTRHPNYFGDFCVWWGVFVIALAYGAPWWTIVGPSVMSVLLIKVSGVALLERGLTSTKPEYAAYAARTSAFFPWPPRGKTETR